MEATIVNELISGTGMILVGTIAAVLWWWISRAQLRWFAVGVGLWVVAVAVKVGIAILTNGPVIGFFKGHLPNWLFITLGGLYVGVESSLCEIGLTLLLVLLWRAPGRDAGRATAVGTGAGAFEAILLGVVAVCTGLVFAFVDHPQVAEARDVAEKVMATTPLIWLIGSVERVLAILCHMSSRTMVLLGVTKRRYWLIFWGFLLFTYIDSAAGAAHVSGSVGRVSMWWIELAIVPAAAASVLVLPWCWRKWGKPEEAAPAFPYEPAVESPEHELPYEEGDNT
ncbi:MAG TPA: YhfC family glutamic-type intramembrane protease [Candidatus Hydrogenedentes bacterium]|nr:YhfC family glutamic-type intramembrane protease [Candidatus Hydrogenedentota bacterium]